MEPWLTWSVMVVTGILGTGGIASWVKARSDAKKGIRESALNENTALSEQWKTLIETQSKSLIDPLTDQVTSLRAEVMVLNDRVKSLETERREWRYRESLLWGWADDLVGHINRQLPPPAPDRPAGLTR